MKEFNETTTRITKTKFGDILAEENKVGTIYFDPYKKEENKEIDTIKSYLTLTTEELKNKVEEVSTVINSLVFETNDINELTKNKKALYDLEKDVKAKRKEHFKNLKDEEKLILNLEKEIKSKHDEVKNAIDKLEREEREARVEKFRKKWEENKGDVFDFIDFDKDVFISTFETKSAFTNSGQPTKAMKEHLIGKIEKYRADKVMLGDDSIALKEYQLNGHDPIKALEESKKTREMLKQEEEIKKQQEQQRQEKEKTEVKEEKNNEQLILEAVGEKPKNEEVQEIIEEQVGKVKIELTAYHEREKGKKLAKWLEQILDEKEILHSIRITDLGDDKNEKE